MRDVAVELLGDDGYPKYNRVLTGRAKKNWKSADLILAALYRFLVWPSAAGNDCFILANDEEQAADDLSLAKKLIAINPVLDREVAIRAKEIIRCDGRGTLKILPARDVSGAHGKTFLVVGFDEIHAYRDYALLEALSSDPTRRDVLTWITSYAGISHAPGIPLYDYLQVGKSGSDPRMLFSWYAADFTTDPAFDRDDLSPEQRANPSMVSWGNDGYLADQKQRLPSNRYRRLHLNLPGSPDGAAFSGEHVTQAIVSGRRSLPPEPASAITLLSICPGAAMTMPASGLHTKPRIAALFSTCSSANPIVRPLTRAKPSRNLPRSVSSIASAASSAMLLLAKPIDSISRITVSRIRFAIFGKAIFTKTSNRALMPVKSNCSTCRNCKSNF